MAQSTINERFHIAGGAETDSLLWYRRRKMLFIVPQALQRPMQNVSNV